MTPSLSNEIWQPYFLFCGLKSQDQVSGEMDSQPSDCRRQNYCSLS